VDKDYNISMVQSVSILGCGWLGRPLGRFLLGIGFSVKGSTRTADSLRDLDKDFISGYSIDLNRPTPPDPSFFDSNGLIVTVPFRRDLSDPNVYFYWLERLIDWIADTQISWVIFTSSTSVYPQSDGVWAESSEFAYDTLRSEVLGRVERLFLDCKIPSIVLRVGGLVGPGRSPVRRIQSTEKISRPNQPVNLIHRDDCIAIISKLIWDPIGNNIYNIVCNDHPTRREYYTAVCKSAGFPLPKFDTPNGPNRIISGEKIVSDLKYVFIYPFVLDMPI